MLVRDLTKTPAPQEYVAPKKTDWDMIDPNLLFGLELEIEGLEEEESERMDRKVPGMVYHEDGSLRNNGGEFVTFPMRRNTLETVLMDFFLKNDLSQDKNYSDRCSVHVHANCSDLEPEQLRLVLCLYMILEKVFFAHLHVDRKDNIFCVPLYETIGASRMIKSIENMMDVSTRWKKYTALNIYPLWSFGTIEFRHMSGTCDPNRILLWCDIIACLFRYARTTKYHEVITTLNNLNTSSDYDIFMHSIFQEEYIFQSVAYSNYKTDLEEGIIEMKLSSISVEVTPVYNKRRTTANVKMMSNINSFNIKFSDPPSLSQDNHGTTAAVYTSKLWDNTLKNYVGLPLEIFPEPETF